MVKLLDSNVVLLPLGASPMMEKMKFVTSMEYGSVLNPMDDISVAEKFSSTSTPQI